MKIEITDVQMTKIDEKILLLTLLGVLGALKSNSISIDEAEKFLFSPHTVKRLKASNCNQSVIEIVERGCELEDIDSLIPDRLNENIENLYKNLLEVLETYQEFDKELWI